ncbi:hypothetical protein PG996_007387 [Apiospora saccharicola]|uniref:Uncharacterized protein n=1 Tax=Apiospora saccharicola TaxID=335842 RepID=A0ABR1VAN5_9PEZI
MAHVVLQNDVLAQSRHAIPLSPSDWRDGSNAVIEELGKQSQSLRAGIGRPTATLGGIACVR